MEANNIILIKQKRLRNNPTKKWTAAEENALIEHLLEHPEIEKPTAQTYYKRFAEKKVVAVEWKLARSRVRNLRVSYNKAKGWEGSIGAGSVDGESDSTISTSNA